MNKGNEGDEEYREYIQDKVNKNYSDNWEIKKYSERCENSEYTIALVSAEENLVTKQIIGI